LISGVAESYIFRLRGPGILPAPIIRGPKETIVKANLHPMYHKVVVQCACGNQFETRSTSTNVHVEICAKCHPYFTGKQRLIDTQG
jgi:large subunit ribosomal protein L31